MSLQLETNWICVSAANFGRKDTQFYCGRRESSSRLFLAERLQDPPPLVSNIFYVYVYIYIAVSALLVCEYAKLLLPNTGLLKMTVGVLTTCHKQYTWNSSICTFFLFNRTKLPEIFVTHLTGALYVHPLWFYKHQHDNRVRSTQNAFSLSFAAILVNCAPSGKIHNYCTPHIIRENFENFLIHGCNYILLSQVYCLWQVVKTPTIILNNPV
jgi:hypothetical protein